MNERARRRRLILRGPTAGEHGGQENLEQRRQPADEPPFLTFPQYRGPLRILRRLYAMSQNGACQIVAGARKTAPLFSDVQAHSLADQRQPGLLRAVARGPPDKVNAGREMADVVGTVAQHNDFPASGVEQCDASLQVAVCRLQ